MSAADKLLESGTGMRNLAIGVGILVAAYVVYKTFDAASKAASAVADAVTAPGAFNITSDQNLVNKAFNAVTGTADGGTLGTNIYDVIHTETGALKWPWQ